MVRDQLQLCGCHRYGRPPNPYGVPGGVLPPGHSFCDYAPFSKLTSLSRLCGVLGGDELARGKTQHGDGTTLQIYDPQWGRCTNVCIFERKLLLCGRGYEGEQAASSSRASTASSIFEGELVEVLCGL